MSHSSEQWTNSLLSQLPRGDIWSREEGSVLHHYAAGYAPRLARVEENADGLLLEMRPETTQQLLSEWETYLELPECVSDESLTFVERRNALISKYHRKGGLQVWNIEAFAAELGFDITVDEIWPHHCLRDCLYPIWPERYRHVLRVTVHNISDFYMTCLDNCLTPLVSTIVTELECALNKFKMAGKYYEFIYEETE